ncbi:HGxxPAAW family protein [Streptomyces sp. NPDC090106]|uniref:HGxxPAAW family protein n=1 Tax=Streptomyces sp. NPDC090106 TaxID=3365946 RepID=UPI003813A542
MSQYDEGHTVAGWTGTAIGTAGTALLGAGVCLVSVPLIAGGLVVVAAALLVTWVLHLAGWGKPPGVRPRAQWPMGARDADARGGHPRCWSCRLAGRGSRATGSAVVVSGDGEAEPAPVR